MHTLLAKIGSQSILLIDSRAGSGHIASGSGGGSYLRQRAHIADVCTGGKEAALAGENGEDGVGMLVQLAQGIDDFGDEHSTKGVEGLGTIELSSN